MGRKKSGGSGGAAILGLVCFGIVLNWWDGLGSFGRFMVVTIGLAVMAFIGFAAVGFYQANQVAQANRSRLCGRLKASVRTPLTRPLQINDLCHNPDSADGNGCQSHRYRDRYMT